MNKGSLSVFLAGMLMLAGSAVLQADPVLFSDLHNPADVLLGGSGVSFYTFTHDITDSGFNPLTDNLSVASLSIFIRDDPSDGFPWIELAHAAFDGVSTPTGLATSYTFGSGLLSFSILSNLQADGILIVNVVPDFGDFYFEASALVAGGERTASVPEPATLTLVGLGMIGAAALSRRRRAIK